MAAFLSLGVLLGSCSESMVREPEAPLERDTNFYINVKIANPSETGTRADGDEDDPNSTIAEAEQKIHKIMFVFYNESKQYVGNATYVNNAQQNTEFNVTTNDNPTQTNLETIMNLIVPVTVAKGSTKPAYVMAYVNPTDAATKDLFNELSEAVGSFRTLDQVIDHSPTSDDDGESGDDGDASSAGHQGFAMNNSVHFDKTGENINSKATVAVPIGASVYESIAEAQAGNTVVIYVERVVAKVKMTKKNTISQNDNKASRTENNNTTTNYILEFEPLGWGLSNLEKRTFIVKNYRSSGNATSFESSMKINNAEYSTINGNLKDGNSNTVAWNDPDNHRSYWAISPTYFNDPTTLKIPSNSDEIYTSGHPITDWDDIANSSLIYRSFNDIYKTGDNPGFGTYGNDFGSTAYTLEHTMRGSVVNDYQKRGLTCALVVGRYKLRKESETTAKYPDNNFYIRKQMSADGIVSTIFISDDDMKKAYLDKNKTVFKLSDGGTYQPATFEENKADFEVKHPTPSILGDGNYVSSRYVTLVLKNTAGYYYKSGDTYKEITTAADIQTVNKDLYENLLNEIGGVEMYKSGYAYFEIPIRHLWHPNPDEGGIVGDKEFTVNTGFYGIVRNHSYTLNVTGIEGIGIGISDPDAPIIPNVENDNYAVKTEIRVLKWRIVPEQNVILRP